MSESATENIQTTKTEEIVLDFGKHEGTLLTRVPLHYLRWMANEMGRSDYSDLAKAELERRGSIIPEIEISMHAIDRASQKLLGHWQSQRKNGEGLYTWLYRLALKAFKSGKPRNGYIKYRRLKFVFKVHNEWPVLMTVMPLQKKKVKNGRNKTK